ncbi:MAG: hypothetical protein ACI9LM_000562 [Alteromonadaceae bacterium]|jgi:hypothetical protein
MDDSKGNAAYGVCSGRMVKRAVIDGVERGAILLHRILV